MRRPRRRRCNFLPKRRRALSDRPNVLHFDLKEEKSERELIPPGESLRLRRVAIENIMYREYLCEDFRNPRFPMPEDVK